MEIQKFNCITELYQDGQIVEDVGPCPMASSAEANENLLNPITQRFQLDGRDLSRSDPFVLGFAQLMVLESSAVLQTIMLAILDMKSKTDRTAYIARRSMRLVAGKTRWSSLPSLSLTLPPYSNST